MTSYKYEIKSIDTHTVEEATRIVVDGFPKFLAKQWWERKTS
ncbi:hypothetical protein [Lysinibacillus xylanilyticus]